MNSARIGTLSARITGALVGSVRTRLTKAGHDCLFLTIDDGPTELSGNLAQALTAKGVFATWFLTGSLAAKHPRQIEVIGSVGHRFGNHGYQHLDAWRHRWTRIADDLSSGLEAVEEATGERCTWTRPPFGRLRPQTFSWIRSNRQQLALWDVMAADFDEEFEPGGMTEDLCQSVRPGSIIVAHDHGQPDRHEALLVAIARLLDEGWTIGPLPTTGLSSNELAP